MVFVWDLPSTTSTAVSPEWGMGVEELLAELKAGTIHLGCRGSRSCTGGLVTVE